jgi:AcrR family transcriptional regulator
MRPQKISDEQLTVKMLEVLRSRGFDGSSLNDLAEVGGLKKASLYHRYPGGKEKLVHSVLDHYNSQMHHDVLEVLTSKKKKSKKKLATALKNISNVYQNGSSNCLYRALSMESGLALYGPEISDQLKQWLDAFQSIGKELGFKKKKAKKLAMKVLIKIQGALILSKIFNDDQPFQDAIEEIRVAYIE